MEVFERAKHVVTEPASVRDIGIFTNPDSAINAAAEMLGKLAVKMAADGIAGLVGPDSKFDFLGLDQVGDCSAGQQK
jgi:hypothetical protein